ncbi:hypothetical protein DFH06DRAFT_1222707 [Mycena polygramma]|nr:hypothetical protein DFH06DRAFT_1222707 [Mycena polygramma]
MTNCRRYAGRPQSGSRSPPLQPMDCHFAATLKVCVTRRRNRRVRHDLARKYGERLPTLLYAQKSARAGELSRCVPHPSLRLVGPEPLALARPTLALPSPRDGSVPRRTHVPALVLPEPRTYLTKDFCDELRHRVALRCTVMHRIRPRARVLIDCGAIIPAQEMLRMV